MEGQSGLSEFSIVSAVEGCPLSRVPLYSFLSKCVATIHCGLPAGMKHLLHKHAQEDLNILSVRIDIFIYKRTTKQLMDTVILSL